MEVRVNTFGVLPCVAMLLLAPVDRVTAQQPEPPVRSAPYEAADAAQPVRIVSSAEASLIAAPGALVRLPNRKLVLMTRSRSGAMEPFYVRGIETGFYDTRKMPDVDYDKVFANYRRMGANTALFMLHWHDIEPRDGQFDFTFADSIVKAAARHDVRIWWVLFMHTQKSQSEDIKNSWIYKLDSKNGADYAIQWLRDPEGNLHKSVSELLQLPKAGEIYPAYGHPEVFPRALRMLRTLARHYKDSPDVIGVQIGNEEGFMYHWPHELPGWETDFNPVTQDLFAQWKRKTGKSDWHAFKLAIVKWWWRKFTTAYHEVDPYRVVSFNFGGGWPEGGDEPFIHLEGVDATTYAEGNIDVIGVMFYDRRLGARIWSNLDQHYDYTFNLPILVPSEIGLGQRWATVTQFQEHAVRSIERGAQGYSTYCYGSLVNDDGTFNRYGIAFQQFADMVSANEDVIHGGLPGPGAVLIQTAHAGATVSQLHRDPDLTLGMLHSPDAYLKDKADENLASSAVIVSISAASAGKYAIEIYRSGKLASREVATLGRDQRLERTLSGVRETEVVFIKVKREDR